MVHKFGGWYADLDIVFLSPIAHLKNVITTDQKTLKKLQESPSDWGHLVSNAIFHFDRGHPLLERSLRGFSNSFNGE